MVSQPGDFKPVKLETSAYFRRRFILMMLTAIPGIYVVFTTILILNDEHSSFARILIRYYTAGVLILLALVGYAIYLHLYKRSALQIRASFPGQYHISITGVDNQILEAHGKWTVLAQHQKIYFKLGTYQKDLWLTLFCDDKAFATFFYRTPAAASAPEEFSETDSPVRPGVPVFVTPKTELIYRYLKSA